MKPIELFEKLENTGNHYSSFRKGKKYIYFSTGGWSENEELVQELKKELTWNLLLVKWERGGHYTFIKPKKEIMNREFKNRGK
jgi:hypothetical protein